MSDQPEARQTPDRAELMTHKPQRWLRPAALVGGAIAVLIVAGGLVSRGLAGQALKTRTLTDAVPTVSVIAPAVVSGAETLTLPGKVAAFNDAQIHARVSGYLKRWYTDIGAQVKTGQILADIDTPEVDQQLAQAQANLATATANQKLAQVTASRWHSLLADDAVSHQEADEKASDLAAKTAASMPPPPRSAASRPLRRSSTSPPRSTASSPAAPPTSAS